MRAWKIEGGYLKGEGIRHCPSPNCDERPDLSDIGLLVIHNISLPPGEFGGGYIEKFFTNKLPIEEHSFFKEIENLQVSSHLLIDRKGVVTQFVPFTHRAWHAGESCYKERYNCNDFSIGIELEGTDNTSYEDVQYEVLVEITGLLHQNYPDICGGSVVGHCDIAPKRKTDPGESFDWERFLTAVDF